MSTHRRRTTLPFTWLTIGLFSLALPAAGEVQLASWGYKIDPPGNVYLASPVALAADAHGSLYVADMGNSRIVRFSASPSGGAPVIHSKIGLPGSAAGQFDLPFGVTVDKQGNLLVVDTANSRIQKLTAAGVPLAAWGSKGSWPGQFRLPREIAVDSQNNYYVTDEFNNRVQVFDQSGVYLRSFGAFGDGPGQFRLPQGIAIDALDRVYVADTFNHRVQVLSSTGSPLASLGQPCEQVLTHLEAMCFPRGVAFDADGNLYVADTFNHRVKKYDASLAFEYNHGSAAHMLYPNAVRPQAEDVFYVTDTGNSRVVRTGPGSAHQVVLGAPRSGNGHFSGPSGMVVGFGNRVYVADTYNHRIQVLDANGNLLGKWGANGGAGGAAGGGLLDGQFLLPQQLNVDSDWNIYVADLGNRRVQVFDKDGSHLRNIQPLAGGQPLFASPTGVAVDRAGNVYVSDLLPSIVYRIDAVSGAVSVVGSAGTAQGQFRQPSQLAVDTDGNLFVADMRNGRIQKFAADGTPLLMWGSDSAIPDPDVLLTAGDGYGEFYFPSGIRAAGAHVYVADTQNNRMQKFDRNGNFIEAWGSFGGATGKFFSPAAVAIGPWGQTYVADSLLHQVRKFAASDGGYTTGPTWPW